MATTKQEQYERLRKLFNSAIRGPNTDAMLWALANPAVNLINNIEAVHDNVYIATAVDRYLDQRLADYNLVRPPEVGLGDDIFRQIGISVINRKQVRELIMSILGVMFGEELTQATARSNQIGPYNLDDGDLLRVKFDGGDVVQIKFETAQFANISAATAQEVADAITKSLRSQGKTGRAFAKDDGSGAYVVLISDTEGPQSSVAVIGGRAQNALLFDKARPTTGGPSTQWTVSLVSGGSLRFTWSAGANPSVGKVRIGDYVNIFGSGFSATNQGTFNITDVKGGTVGNAYFEIENPTGVPEIVLQGTPDGVLFFQPFKNSLTTKSRYAAVFQEESRLLEVFIPATTKVVRRDRKGASHIHEPVLTTETYIPGVNQIADITFPAPSSINDGDYFLINSANDTNQYYVYLSKIVGTPETLVAQSSAFNSVDTVLSQLGGPNFIGSGQSFQVTSSGSISKIRVPLRKVGNPTGNMQLRVYTNPLGYPNPAGTLLGQSDLVNASLLSTSFSDIDFNFSTQFTLTPGNEYLFVFVPYGMTLTGADIVQIRTNTSGGYPNGDAVLCVWSGGPVPGSYGWGSQDYVFSVFTQSSPFDPNILGRTGIPVDITSATTATDVARSVSNTLNGFPYFQSAVPSSPVSRICWLQSGATTAPVNGNISGLSIAQIQSGSDTVDTSTSTPNPDELLPDQEGPYVYDLSQPFVLSDTGTESTAIISPDSGRVIEVLDSSDFPDEQGFVMIGYGTDKQEGPVPYLARPSNNTILLSPAYRIINTHAVGTEIRFVAQTGPVSVDKAGADFPAYLTDVVAGRTYAENLVKEVAATGINIVITILYPGDEGLGRWSTEDSEKVAIWGEDSDV